MTSTTNDFIPFPKIPRLNRDIIITEKIDGTNAQIVVREDGAIVAGSRTRYIDVKNDNFGFAKWVEIHADELISGLGPGQHFGEWWGVGIQRGYDLFERRFSLFNVHRWNKDNIPSCCSVVPTLYEGPYSLGIVDKVVDDLRAGSVASPGYYNPEGVVVYMKSSNSLFKVLCQNDDIPKGLVNE